jgi:hypothetical protein
MISLPTSPALFMSRCLHRTHNALISALVGISEKGQQRQEEMSLGSRIDANVDEGIKWLRDMMQLGDPMLSPYLF